MVHPPVFFYFHQASPKKFEKSIIFLNHISHVLIFSRRWVLFVNLRRGAHILRRSKFVNNLIRQVWRTSLSLSFSRSKKTVNRYVFFFHQSSHQTHPIFLPFPPPPPTTPSFLKFLKIFEFPKKRCMQLYKVGIPKKKIARRKAKKWTR